MQTEFAPDPSIRAEPILMRSAGARGGQRAPGARSGRNGTAKAPGGARSGTGKLGGAGHRSGTRHH